MLFIVVSGIVGAGAIFFALWPYAPSVHFWPCRFRGPRGPLRGWAGGRRTAGNGHDNLP